MNTLIHLLYFQGLRGNEVRNLLVEDLELGNGGFFVKGKGRDGDKEWVRFHPRTLKVMKTYLKEMKISSGYVFPSRNDSGLPISQPTMWRYLRKVFQEVGVETNPHSFRKSFVSGLIEGGMDLITVSRFSRHKSIQQLQTYYDRVSTERSFPQFVDSLEVSPV
jgi:integrase